MKKVFTILLLLCCGVMWGQEENSINAIKKALIEIENDKTSIGKITISDNIDIYCSNKEHPKENIQKIDSVRIDLQEGMLEHIIIYVGSDIFSNKKAPISISYSNTRRVDKLYNSSNTHYILFKDAIRIESNKRFGFIPNDDTFILTNQNRTKLLSKKNNINSLVNFAAYTDFLGLVGEQPNSLINFEANAKFYLIRYNVFNRFMYFTPSIQPSVIYNKVDSQFEVIIVDANKINPTEIYRRYNYAVGLDLTLFKWDFEPSNSLELKAGYQYSSSKIQIKNSGINPAPEIRAVNHIKYFDLTLGSKVLDNFGIELSTKLLFQSLNKSSFYEASRNKMLGFRGGIYYFPPNSNKNNSIFLRFTNYLVFDKRELDFSQIQVGFSKSLNF